MLKPFPFMPLPDLTRQGMKRFVEAEQTLIDSVMKRKPETRKVASKKPRARKRPVRLAKAQPVTVGA